jgi:DNA-binding PadR family transcriptional regulator
MTVSTLGYALLGLLAREPLSGLDLTRALPQRLAYFWHARHSQVYPELARLEADGLVTHTVVPQRDRPDKKVYRPTELGIQVLRDWVAAPTALPSIRDELVLKVASFWLIEPEHAAAQLLEQARLHDERLALYERFERDLRAQDRGELADPGAPTFATHLTLQRGIGYEREYAAWCRAAAARIERGAGDNVATDAPLDID